MSVRVAKPGEFKKLALKKEQNRLAFNQIEPAVAQKQAEAIFYPKSYDLEIPANWGSRFDQFAD
jgi:hypothetical protein